MDPLLRVFNLSKRFGTLTAIHQVDFDVYPGEVVGLAGRSGSGKSVLAMLLAGLDAPDMGDIYFAEQRLTWPFQTHRIGLEVIHQRPNLAENLSITSNIFLGNEMGWPKKFNWLKTPNERRMDLEANRILTELGVRFNSLEEKVSNLSSEQRQLIAIARTVACPARLIVADEPTGLLSYSFQQQFLSLIQTWQQQGLSIIFGSKNLEHLFAVADRILVLRDGRLVANCRTDETSREEIVAALIGSTDRRQLTPAIWALDSYYQAREQAEKLRHQQTLLEQNLAAQDTLNQRLIDQLAEQVRALDQANFALQDAQRRLLTEREQERKHLARELHDQVIQDLLSVNYQLEEIEEEANGVTLPLKDDLLDVRERIRTLIDDLRRICGDLRPPTIDSLGLGAALQSYTQDWAARTDIKIMLDLSSNLGRLPETLELSIFRIVQEGLSNVRKHARASSVKVSLKHTSPRMVMISISDNGQGLTSGFDLSTLSAKGHYGLLGIGERIALLGGRLKLQNQTDGGLILEVEIPHPKVDMTMSSMVKKYP
jgi:signal transduction histidine kinase